MNRTSMNPLRAGLVAATVLTGLAIGGPAEAATTGTAQVVNRTQILYKAAAKRVNHVTITRSGNTVTIDDRVTIKPGAGCRQVSGDKTRVRCTTSGTPTWGSIQTYDLNDTIVNRADLGLSIRPGSGTNTVVGGPRREDLYGGDERDTIHGGGGNDYIYPGYGTNVVYGGPGDDNIKGGGNTDTIHGEAGNDRIDPGAGNDVVRGGAGDDMFDEGTGRDALYGDDGSDSFWQGGWNGVARDGIHGGAGWDTVEYMARSRAVAADLDGRAGDDGQNGEGDSIGTDVESLRGGRGNDWLAGNAANNGLDGGEGHDTLYGLGGDDQLSGGEGTGNDRLYGGAGDDQISADYGNDLMYGGYGVDTVDYGYRLVPVEADLDGQIGDDGSGSEQDTIGTDVEGMWGGWAADLLTGNGGDNLIHGSAGADVIRGGAGDDTLHADDSSRTGLDRVFGEAGDDTLYGGGSETYSRYSLDGGDGTDACLHEYYGTGDRTNCESTSVG
ncbi:calcium-binding protein [Actinoplanes xinjiangensis]|uniref:calcium-binding protein n=1 Tax=Actinoplanes xinjiangensis TaxID=512350 RepID=UPI00341B9DC5